MNPGNNILVSAGETSGDIHTAALLRSLGRRMPNTSFFGMGGAAMRSAGVDISVPMEDMEIMGFVEVLGALLKVRKAIRTLLRYSRERKPSAAILTDFSGFHFRLGPRLKALGIPVIYFISPKLWAWWKGRVKKVHRFVDLMITILPFEEEFYRQNGFGNVFYAGNPLMDELSPVLSLSAEEAAAELGLAPGGIIAVLPGSRTGEITRHTEPFLDAAGIAAEHLGRDVQVAAALPDKSKMRVFRDITGKNVRVFEGKAHLLLRAARVALVASGTATLEAGILDTPSVVGFKAGTLSMAIARSLVQVRWIGLVNLILGREVFPEHIQDIQPAALAADIERFWDGEERSKVLSELEDLRSRLGPEGALDRAAETISRFLTQEKPSGKGS